MEKTFAPQEIETKWYKTWEDRGYFAPNMSGSSDAASPTALLFHHPMSPAACTSATPCNTALWTL